MKRVVIGSRGSELALAQTRMMAAQLAAVAPDVEVVIEIITTKGDKITDTPLAKIGGKGLFTKELEAALLDGSVDLAVHSLKDLPTELPDGLALAAVPPREDPRDALVCARVRGWEDLPQGARVGTSSLRRKVQLLAVRPDLEIVDLRGNVPTRLRKLHEQGLDAIVLACAGLNRLGLAQHITQPLPAEVMLPAVGQGALGLEARAGDHALNTLLARLHDANTFAEVRAERALLNALGGGCQTPLAAVAHAEEDTLTLHACIASATGDRVLRTARTGPLADAEALGRETAAQLLRDGALPMIQRAVRVAVHGDTPLRGRKIVVTRARTQAPGLAEELRVLGAEVFSLPTIEIHPLSPTPLPLPAQNDWIVFTSVNGVEHYLRCLDGPQRIALRSSQVCAVGPATAAALQRAGIPVNLTPKDYVAEGLVAALGELEGGLAGRRFILPQGNLARPMLSEALRAQGATVVPTVVYETRRAELSDAEIDAVLAAKPELVCLTSSSTAENLHALLGAERLAALASTAAFASIGPITTQTAEALGLATAFTATPHDVPGLIDGIVAHFARG